MCTKRPPPAIVQAAPKALDPVAPLVSAEDPSLSAADNLRKRGKDALKVSSVSATGKASSGLNIP